MKLIIKDLHASVLDEDDNIKVNILKGVDLEIDSNELHAIMGPNGTGKSTLASVIMGDPKYTVTKGSILLDGKEVLDMEVDERARAGIFLAMQYPSEITGVTNNDFMQAAKKAKLKEGQSINLLHYIDELETAVEDLKMDKTLPHRYINEGFSGGERKRNEILQMKMLKPSLAILDEIDSGLDIDALRIVGENVNSMRSDSFSALIITHYQRLLDYVDVDYVHIMIDGKIVKSGKRELIEKIDKNGYDWLKVKKGKK